MLSSQEPGLQRRRGDGVWHGWVHHTGGWREGTGWGLTWARDPEGIHVAFQMDSWHMFRLREVGEGKQ